jgi:hypothetical protein
MNDCVASYAFMQNRIWASVSSDATGDMDTLEPGRDSGGGGGEEPFMSQGGCSVDFSDTFEGEAEAVAPLATGD